MAYFLRQDKKKKGIYLQMYETHWDKEKKQPRSKSVEAFGYVDELVSDAIPDPVAYYKDYVEKKNKERKAATDEGTRPRAFHSQPEKNVGHFLAHSLLNELGVRETIEILASRRRFQFDMYEMIAQLIYARIIYPCSKAKTVSTVFPCLYGGVGISEDQVYDGCSFIGESYKKYIELFNHCYEQHYKRDFGSVFFDCTNYYFEIDLPNGDKQKGPSKENRHDPIIGQALLLDSDLVPLAMQMYPGNESEKPYIRKTIEEMKQRYKVSGRTVQVADKGLNCARNIFAAVKEANDGYIFSKSIHGRCLSETEKQWVLLENDANVYTDYKDSEGQVLFRLKSCVDDFKYRFKETDPDTGEEVWTEFTVKEKRVVSYNPSLARKQKAEISRMVEKASNYATYKKIAREDLGDSAKYLRITSKDKDGNKIRPVAEIDQAKIDEDMRYAGYNLLVTSEVDLEPLQIYNTYHGLWKIEESFRITKTQMRARPIYLARKDRICAHLLVVFIALLFYRILERKLAHPYTDQQIMDCLRDMYIARYPTEDSYHPAYERTDLTDDIHQYLGFNTDYERMTDWRMRGNCRITKGTSKRKKDKR